MKNPLKSRDRKYVRMTRYGAVEIQGNQATNISKRETDQFTNDLNDSESPTQVSEPHRKSVISHMFEQMRRTRTQKKRYKVKSKTYAESDRIEFSETDRANPKLSKYIKRSEKAADKVESAGEKLPKKRKLTTERIFDEVKQKPQTRLKFDETVKPPDTKLYHSPLRYPVQTVLNHVHNKIRETEKENSGVEAAHKSEELAEAVADKTLHTYKKMSTDRKFKPYRTAEKLQVKSDKANTEFRYRKVLEENPQIKSNPISRLHQKHRIKKEYAAARAGKSSSAVSHKAKKAVEKITKTGVNVLKFAVHHWKGIVIAIAALVLLILILSGISACSSVLMGGLSDILTSTYLAEDEDIDSAEMFYTELESELISKIEAVSYDYPDYDEYIFDIGDIGHDFYELISYLTVIKADFTFDEVESVLQELFNEQYSFNITEVVELRIRNELQTDSYGNIQVVQIPYEYKILYVTLESCTLDSIFRSRLTEEELQWYEKLISTKGGRM